MKTKKRFFPIDYIPKNSRVLLYGAGRNGIAFLEWNQRLEWCEIVGFVDEKEEHLQKWTYKRYALTEILKADYDYIYISITNELIRNEVSNNLLKIGVEKKKIIDQVNCFYLRDDDTIVYEEEQKEGQLEAALIYTGAMGDVIIELSVLQDIVKNHPEVIIDVYSADKGFEDAVFYGQKGIRKLIKHHPSEEEKKHYDVVILIMFEPYLERYNRARVKISSPEWLEGLDHLYSVQEKDRVDAYSFQYVNRITLDRAKMLGYNRYTWYSYYKAFNISDMHSELFLNEKYRADYEKLELPEKYITFNYGSNRKFAPDGIQTKMWPEEYHILLNGMIKEEYPDIEIIQLGDGDSKKIDGTDRFVFGKSLETVKYILKNAILHIDCEGGLVHMASSLGTKCVVVFGPTPIWFLGYKDNINISPAVCGECKALIKDWYTRCYRYDRPECMYSITPEHVMDRIRQYLESRNNILQ